jgi:mannose-6-phosphate isomerase-like protein (cupin superfamily)
MLWMHFSLYYRKLVGLSKGARVELWLSSVYSLGLSLPPTYTCAPASPALGLGLSLFYSTVLKEFRLVERLRLIWNEWWDWGSKMEAPFRLPVTLLQQEPDRDKNLDQFLQLNDDGYIQLLACPRNIATSTMQVSILSLSVGREIPPRRSKGVEFYYVLSGSGLFSQQGVADTVQIKAGQAFIVDPHCYRWISNRVGVTKLVLLRATDNASNRNYSTRNGSLSVIRLDPNRATLGTMATKRHVFTSMSAWRNEFTCLA